MAIVLAQDWRRYGASADIEGFEDDVVSTVWTRGGSATIQASPGSRWGTQTLRTQSSSQVVIQLGTLVSGSTLIVSHMYLATPSSQSVNWIDQTQLQVTNSGSQHVRSTITAGGTINVFNASDAFVTKVDAAMEFGVWHHFEWKFSLLDSGSVSLKLNGVLIINAVAGDFRSGTGNTSNINRLVVGGLGFSYFDDMLIMDGSGSTFNDYKGDFRYEMQVADADGGTTQWTASAGSNFQCIDDAVGFSSGAGGAGYDADYISEATTDDINLSSHGSVTASGYSTIFFVQLYLLARSDTTGDKLAHLCKSSATTTTGADLALSGTTATAYRWRRGYFETDPNGGGAWTPTNINAAEFGIKKRV